MNIKRVMAGVLVGGFMSVVPLTVAPATGDQPCTGCVGNADAKSPKGQSDGDKNAGYECDRNHGVGQGNPAHSNNCEQPNG